jgi:hypothetical protein
VKKIPYNCPRGFDARCEKSQLRLLDFDIISFDKFGHCIKKQEIVEAHFLITLI